MTRKTTFVLALTLAVLAGACGRKIGDKCRDPIECNSEDNTRVCDLAQPGGYCTIVGCDEKSCPDDAVCIRFFSKPEFLSKACDVNDPRDCEPHELCVDYPPVPSRDSVDAADPGVPDAGAVDPRSGRCVPRSTEARNCMASCGDDDDCREEYVCRPSGPSTNSIALTPTPGEVVKFCVPR